MGRIAVGVAGLIGSIAMIASVTARAGDEKATDPKAASSGKVDFNRDIRPIFANYCYACHGPDEKRRKAGLRLDRKDVAFSKLTSGSVPIVAGDLDASELFARISSEDEEERMPPKSAGKPLSPAQIELVRRWIEQGAPWKDHWAYIPPERPSLPSVRNTSWPRNGIDYFILARLEREGLAPSPEADRATLLRRLSFDLTGLPPTPAEVDAFLADTSAEAYERVVDRLLASPHYGERIAQQWLDLARYADTNGYHIDNQREMWKWREWVIDAFNKNEPFDVFTIEQLAGDLLPGSTLEQRIASGFNRNCMINFEGGADPDEYLTKYIVDRVTTTATVWLGTTLACTECHDHKYDPFTQKEFYQLYAFFHNIPEKGLDGSKSNAVPSVKVPTPEQDAQLKVLRAKVAEVDGRISAELARVKLEDVPTSVADVFGGPREYAWVDEALPAGATADGSDGARSWKWVSPTGGRVVSGTLATARTAPGLSQQLFTGAADPLRVADEDDELFAYVYLDPFNPPKTIMLQFHDGSWEHRAYWGANLIDSGTDQTPSRLAMGPLPEAGRWVRLEVECRSVGLAPGAAVGGLAFTQFDGTVYWDRAGIVSRSSQGPMPTDSLSAWEDWERPNKKSNLPKTVRELIQSGPDGRAAAAQTELRNYFVQRVYSKTRERFEPLNKQYDQAQKAETDFYDSIPSTMVMQEMEEPRETFVLVRGDFQTKGEKVTPGVPAALPPLAEGVKADRLALAKWLVAPNHPLTGRVTVNRYWEQYFGTGIVKTGEDFGSQGEFPVHPELLDWLATELVAQKWNIKALQKMIVMSATYRQTAKLTPELLKRDPDNRLLARGPRFRLPAEMIRDNALAVSGLLNLRIGGPSVRPYQPAGLWEAISFGREFSAQTYVQSTGPDLYRRGIYMFWKRSLPHPSMITFDAPNREVCTDRRPRTNTPLQALLLLNDPIYVECARGLAQRTLREAGIDDAVRLSFAFRLCTGRLPRGEELNVLLRTYRQQLARFKSDPKAAEKLVSVGESPRPADVDTCELAAWTAIGNILLNLDETISKG